MDSIPLALRVLINVPYVVGIAILILLAIQYLAASPEGQDKINEKSFRYFSIAVILSLITFAMISWIKGDPSLFLISSSVFLILLMYLLIILICEKEVKSLSKNDPLHQCFKAKLEDNILAMGFILCSFVIVCFTYPLSESRTIPLIIMIVCGVLIFLCGVYQMALLYRFHKGLYGTNYFEAREIVDYILNHMDYDSDGGTPKIKFTEEEINERVLRLNGSEKYAG